MTQTLDRAEAAPVDLEAVQIFELGERMLDGFIADGNMAETQMIEEKVDGSLARVALMEA